MYVKILNFFKAGSDQPPLVDENIELDAYAEADALIRSIYELTKMGPTSTNCCPARFKFIKSEEQKLKLKESLLPNNIDKVMSDPVHAYLHGDTEGGDVIGSPWLDRDYELNQPVSKTAGFFIMMWVLIQSFKLVPQLAYEGH